MTYIIAGAILLCMLIIFLTYNRIVLLKDLQYAKQQLEYYKEKTAQLENEKLLFVRQVEQLSGKVEYREKLITEFGKLKEESKELTKSALFDLGAKISHQLIEIHKQENQESRALSEKTVKDTTDRFNAEFKKIMSVIGELNKEISQSRDTVDIIKNSLLSPSGAGSLAEITLENILKSSGLKLGTDYIMQYSIINKQENIALRPDCIIFLPGNRVMIVDAKASKFLTEDKGETSNLARSMNNHLRALNNRSYADAIRKTLDNKITKQGNIVTLMFLPSEQAIEKVADADKEFMHKAWEADIFPVGPAGLMNMLSFARFQISEQMMVQNNLLIIEEVKRLMSSISIMAEYSAKLGNSLSGAVNNYDRFAASFNRNFLAKAKKISRMGIDGGLKKDQESLRRLQVFISKSDLIEIDKDDSSKKLEEK